MHHRDPEVTARFFKRKTILAGLQHVLVMYAGAVMVPLILGAALGFSPKDLTYLISADLFTCGIATLLQAGGIGKFVGIKLPVIMGCTPIALFPMIAAGKTSGIPAIYGSIIAGGVFVFLIAPLFHRISRFFPPIVVGTVITVIGLTLVVVGANNIAGAADHGAILNNNLMLATVVMVTIILVNKFFKGFIKNIAVLISLFVGTLIAYYISGIDFNILKETHWVNVITPFYFGIPQFKIGPIIAMCFVSLVIIIESTSIFYTLGEMCDKKIKREQIVVGLRTEGLAQMLGGIFNSFPYNTFAQNVGLVALSSVKSRYVAIAAGIILLVLGSIPKFAAMMTLIPKPVLGGAIIILYSTITAYGIRICSKVDFKDTNNLIIIASSIGVALTITLKPELFSSMPNWLVIAFGNGVITGSLLAVLLNLLLNGVKTTSSETQESES